MLQSLYGSLYLNHRYLLMTIIFFLGTSVFDEGAAEPARVFPTSIEIFITPENSMSIPDQLQSRTTLYDLSAPDHLFNAVNATLPSDPAAAQSQAKTLISNTNFNTDVRLAYQGIARAASYGLTRYPAIVFDGGRAVVYGQTDLNAAVHTYQRWQEAQHDPS